MKVLNIDEVVKVFDETITEPEGFNVDGVKNIDGCVIVYLTVKDCYDSTLSDGMFKMATNFLYSHKDWGMLVNAVGKGYLIQSHFDRFVNSANRDFYNYYVVSDGFDNIRKDLSEQLNNVIDDFGCVFSLSDDISVKLAVNNKPFYREGFVLERLCEYTIV